MIALVGTTGAGKSTVINLLARFYEADSGEILVDENPIRDLSISALRRQIGMVTQECFLFNGTIRENLQIGKPDATDEELLEAAAVANRVPSLIACRTDEQRGRGARSKVERGRKAAAFDCAGALKDPPILILDEATASVDTTTERLIQEALETLMFDRTSIVIAHRLSTVVHADLILVLDQAVSSSAEPTSNCLRLGGNTRGCANKDSRNERTNDCLTSSRRKCGVIICSTTFGVRHFCRCLFVFAHSRAIRLIAIRRRLRITIV